MNVEIPVRGIPPYKSIPADSSERKKQRSYRERLRSEAQKHFKEPIMGDIRMEIYYTRAKGRADPANIIGGVADALEGIAYINDRQLVEIHYREEKGRIDKYLVRISSI